MPPVLAGLTIVLGIDDIRVMALALFVEVADLRIGRQHKAERVSDQG